MEKIHPIKPVEVEIKERYTLEDLQKAREELKFWEDRFVNTSSNNPDKFRSQIKDANRKIRRIKDSLKASGLLEKTDTEKLTQKLDSLYPNSKSRRIVTWEGDKYQIRYFPLDKSRSGKTVHEWGHEWRLVEDTPKKTTTEPNGS